jgi:hypothetical protein
MHLLLPMSQFLKKGHRRVSGIQEVWVTDVLKEVDHLVNCTRTQEIYDIP